MQLITGADDVPTPASPEPESPGPAGPARAHLAALDGLRGIAVLLVVVAHGSLRLLPARDRLALGGIGVQIFFVLSGYLITSLLLAERRERGRISLRDFYMRRALRIWPLYYAVLVFYLFIGVHVHGHLAQDFSIRHRHVLTWAFPLFLQNYVEDTTHLPLGLSVFWSLAIEEQFYLVWPLILVVLTHPRARSWCVPAFLGLVLVGSQFVRAVTLRGHLPLARGGIDWMTHTNVSGLAMGALLAWISFHRPVRPAGGFAYVQAWVLLVMLCARGSVWAQQHRIAWVFPNFAYYEGLLLALCVVSILDRLTIPGVRSRILGAKPLVHVGKVSYGLYVLHPIVLAVVAALARERGLDGRWCMLGFCVLSIAVATVVFYGFERPILRFKKRFQRVGVVEPRPGARAGAAPGASSAPEARAAPRRTLPPEVSPDGSARRLGMGDRRP